MTTPNSGDTVTIDYVLKRTDGEEVGNTRPARRTSPSAAARSSRRSKKR